MIDRSLSIAIAAGALVLTAMMPQQASALPRVGVDTQAAPALVQQAGTRYFAHRRTGSYVRVPFTEVDTRRGTWVAAPFARVYSGRRGTWVRAPFVNLRVPRD